MTIHYLRLAVFLILSSSILSLSCKKDGGSLPDYDLNTPYYENLEFEDAWSLDLSHLNFPWDIYSPTLKIANEDILIAYDLNIGILAIDAHNGDVVWHLEQNGSYEIAYNSDFIALSDRIVFYDRIGITSVDLLTGQLINSSTFDQIDGILGSPLSFISDNTSIYAMTYQRPLDSGIQRLYKINPSTLEAELLIQLNDINYDANPGHISLDLANNKVYFLSGKGLYHTTDVILAEVNLDDNTHIIHEIGEHPSLLIHSFGKPLAVYNNIAYLPISFSNGFVVYDLETSLNLGTLEGVKYIRPYGTTLIAIEPSLVLFDPETFQVKWRSNTISFNNILSDTDEEAQAGVFRRSTTLIMISLTDGQLLMRQLLEEDTERYYSSNLEVSRKHNLIFTAGYDDLNRHGFIRCIKSTIDL